MASALEAAPAAPAAADSLLRQDLRLRGEWPQAEDDRDGTDVTALAQHQHTDDHLDRAGRFVDGRSGLASLVEIRLGDVSLRVRVDHQHLGRPEPECLLLAEPLPGLVGVVALLGHDEEDWLQAQ